MKSIKTYIEWRGDLLFDQDPFNEVDGAILSELSYIDFHALAKNTPKTIEEAALAWAQWKKEDFVKEEEIIRQDSFDLLILCGKSQRFGPLKIQDFVYEISLEDDSQFGAISFLDRGRLLFVAFQGTDLHVLGWKEDFALTYLPAIPSQEKARAYLEKQLDQVDYPILVGGHSKGGNLAIYSLIYQKPEYQDRVARVYNYDGPGFNRHVIRDEAYKRVVDKIYTYIPQDSLVGLLLHRLEEPIVIKSTSKNVSQHLSYSWEVDKNSFKPSSLSKDAKTLSLVLDKTLDQLNENQRRDLTHAIFSLFGEDLEDNLILGTTYYNIKKFQQAILRLGKLPSPHKKLLVDVVVSFIKNRLDTDLGENI